MAAHVEKGKGSHNQHPREKNHASGVEEYGDDHANASKSITDKQKRTKVSTFIFVLALGSSICLMTLSALNLIRWIRRRRHPDRETVPLREWIDQDARLRSDELDDGIVI